MNGECACEISVLRVNIDAGIYVWRVTHKMRQAETLQSGGYRLSAK